MSSAKYHEGVVVGNMFGGLNFTLYSLCVAGTNDFLEPEILTPGAGGWVMTQVFGAAILLRRSILVRSHQSPALAAEKQDDFQVVPRTYWVVSEMDLRSEPENV